MENKKTDVFDYLDWRGEFSFGQSAFNEVDALILSIFAYMDFSCTQGRQDCTFADAVQMIWELPDEVKYDGPQILMHPVVELARKAASTRRFCDMKAFGFVNITEEEREIQFSAVTFLLPDDTLFIAFRGTDNTLVGWKEDFNMSFTDGIPAQIEATGYVENILANSREPVRLGGHSKGGNLAVWAGAHQSRENKERMLRIYSNDGPGFGENFLNLPLYQDVREKIVSFVPESSIVGVLMEHDQYITIRSKYPSLLQHDPFSWIVLGSHFLCDNDRTKSGRQFERRINAWIRAMSPKEREEVVESLYDIILSSNAKTLDDLDNNKVKSLLSMSKAYKEMDPKKQAQLSRSLGKLLFSGDLADS